MQEPFAAHNAIFCTRKPSALTLAPCISSHPTPFYITAKWRFTETSFWPLQTASCSLISSRGSMRTSRPFLTPEPELPPVCCLSPAAPPPSLQLSPVLLVRAWPPPLVLLAPAGVPAATASWSSSSCPLSSCAIRFFLFISWSRRFSF